MLLTTGLLDRDVLDRMGILVVMLRFSILELLFGFVLLILLLFVLLCFFLMSFVLLYGAIFASRAVWSRVGVSTFFSVCFVCSRLIAWSRGSSVFRGSG